ncbi:MAG: hypothetical protein MZU91_12630 [Desulfosudis oleivorans]|nr:hypothetical protein [Desulfosudis oleivorans]
MAEVEVVAEEDALRPAWAYTRDRRRVGQRLLTEGRQRHHRLDRSHHLDHALHLRRRHEHRLRREDRRAALPDHRRQPRLAQLGVERERQRVAVEAEAEAVAIELLDRRSGALGRRHGKVRT